MQSKQFGDKIYLRVDKGDEIIDSILATCSEFDVKSATFQGIGGCGNVGIQTMIPEENDFVLSEMSGMLEMVSIIGNITCDDKGTIYQHAHAQFAYLDEQGNHCVIAGHLHHAVVSYTAEIVIEPVAGVIGRKVDPATGIVVWDLG